MRYLRYYGAVQRGEKVEHPKTYLAVITTRIAIDHLGSARVRREVYPGFWLPEPVVNEREYPLVRRTEMLESLSMAFLVLLESLSVVERAVFLLRQVFD